MERDRHDQDCHKCQTTVCSMHKDGMMYMPRQSVQVHESNHPEHASRRLKVAVATRYAFYATYREIDLNYRYRFEKLVQKTIREQRLVYWQSVLMTLQTSRINLLIGQKSIAEDSLYQKNAEIAKNNRNTMSPLGSKEMQDPSAQLVSRITEYLDKVGMVRNGMASDTAFIKEIKNSHANKLANISDIRIDMTLDIDQQLLKAQSNGEYAKDLVKALQLMDPSEHEKYAAEIKNDFFGYVTNENTCRVVDCLAQSCESVVKMSKILLSESLVAMMNKDHTCKLVYTLCMYSAASRDTLLFIMKSVFSRLVTTLQGAILISLLVHFTKEVEKCKFIEIELKRDNGLVKKQYFCRAFTSYMHKCPADNLNNIAAIFRLNISHIINDKYGNYLLQIFFERNCQEGINLCLSSVMKSYKKSFMRKYSKYVLLKALKTTEASQLAKPLLDKLLKDTAALSMICQNKFTNHLILLALLKSRSRHHAAAIQAACHGMTINGSDSVNNAIRMFVSDVEAVMCIADDG